MNMNYIKPLVNEYAKNSSILVVSDDNISQYTIFLNFLFKKLNFLVTYDESLNVWNQYHDDIDMIILHIDKDSTKVEDFMLKIRELSSEVVILIFTTYSAVTLKEFCYADGLLPSPFKKDNAYFALYRHLKRILNLKELNHYISLLEDVDSNYEEIKEEIKHKKEDELSFIQNHRLDDIRFNTVQKISAEEFVSQLDYLIVDKIELFLESLENYAVVLDSMINMDSNKSQKSTIKIIEILSVFYYSVDTLSTFPVIVRTFNEIVTFLNSLTIEQLEESDKKAMLIEILEGLGKDLENWIVNIFQEMNTDDIHYFDASFANNVLEMEAIFNEQTIVTDDDEDDLEFF